MPKATNKYERRVLWLKRWIWVYFWLLIFEGVFRKWIVPSLSGPLLLVRDPVAVIIYIQAYRCRKFSMKTMWPFALLAAGMFLLASTQIIAGHRHDPDCAFRTALVPTASPFDFCDSRYPDERRFT